MCKIRIIYYIALVLMFSSCTGDQEGNNNIISIRIFYLRGHIEYNTVVDCYKISKDSLPYKNITDTLITDLKVLYEIDSIIQILNIKNTEFNIDPRIRCEINYYNGKKQTLCLGERIGIKLDDKSYDNNFMLMYLIKSNSGYYQYFPYNYLQNFIELKDSIRLKAIKNSMKRKLYLNLNDTTDREIIEIIPF